METGDAHDLNQPQINI